MHFIFQLTFARFYMPVFLPDAEKAIYLDDDVIVQGEVHSFIIFKDPRIHILSYCLYINWISNNIHNNIWRLPPC